MCLTARVYTAHRPVGEEEYVSIYHITKHYEYMAIAEGVVGVRKYGCWCPACIGAKGRAKGTMDSVLRVDGCKRSIAIFEKTTMV